MQVTKEVNEVIVGAIEYARENKHEYVTAEHILYKCTFIEKVQNAMEKCGADIENLRKNLNEYFNEYIKTTDSAGIQESYSFQQVILIAGEQCIASGKNIIEIDIINNLTDKVIKEYYPKVKKELSNKYKIDITSTKNRKKRIENLMDDLFLD